MYCAICKRLDHTSRMSLIVKLTPSAAWDQVAGGHHADQNDEKFYNRRFTGTKFNNFSSEHVKFNNGKRDNVKNNVKFCDSNLLSVVIVGEREREKCYMLIDSRSPVTTDL